MKYHTFVKFIIFLSFGYLISCGEGGSDREERGPSEYNGMFAMLHEKSEQLYDQDGSWGTKQYGYRMMLRDSYWRADVYGELANNNRDPDGVYTQRSAEAINYLVRAQAQGQSGVYGIPADVNNPEFGDSIARVINICPECIVNGWISTLPTENISELYYDHGYALTVLSKAYLRSPDTDLLASIREGADWVLDKPVDKNVNYVSALIKGLAYAFRATKDERYRTYAINLHREGVAPFIDLEAGHALDDHNQQLEYHGFIVSGVVALLSILSAESDDFAEMSKLLVALVDHMRERTHIESAPLGATWPGTNVWAWHELSQLRALSLEEAKALQICLSHLIGYKNDIESETGFRLQKAIYSTFSVGLYSN